MVELAEQRRSVYAWLALVYLHEPTGDFARMLKNQQILSFLNEVGIDVDQRMHGDDEEGWLEELEMEYTRLFIGPGEHVSPYESVWHDDGGMLWGKTTAEIKKFIESLGLKYRTEWSGLPDHVGVELELMHRLITREHEAWMQRDRQNALLCLEIENKFVDEHLSRWIPRFCERVIHESFLDFYKQVAQLTEEFIEFDRKQINDLLEAVLQPPFFLVPANKIFG